MSAIREVPGVSPRLDRALSPVRSCFCCSLRRRSLNHFPTQRASTVLQRLQSDSPRMLVQVVPVLCPDFGPPVPSAQLFLRPFRRLMYVRAIHGVQGAGRPGQRLA